MKILVIYANDSKPQVDELRRELAEKYGENSVLRLYSTKRKKGLLPHAWHKDAVKMMELADIIVYAVSSKSSTNKNVNWELKKAQKLEKYIVCLPMEPGVKVENPCLMDVDKNTKQEICKADIFETKEKLFAEIDGYIEGAYMKLFTKNADPQILLEQYKMFQETAENLTTRRQNVNSFYISANTALITIGGTIFAIGSEGELWSKLVVLLALSVPGIMLNISWGKMLQSYYLNNLGKMKVLSLMESKLAACLYDAEWKAMKNKFNKKKYVSFTENEKTLPWVFGVFFGFVDLFCLIALGPMLLQLFK